MPQIAVILISANNLNNSAYLLFFNFDIFQLKKASKDLRLVYSFMENRISRSIRPKNNCELSVIFDLKIYFMKNNLMKCMNKYLSFNILTPNSVESI